MELRRPDMECKELECKALSGTHFSFPEAALATEGPFSDVVSGITIDSLGIFGGTAVGVAPQTLVAGRGAGASLAFFGSASTLAGSGLFSGSLDPDLDNFLSFFSDFSAFLAGLVSLSTSFSFRFKFEMSFSSSDLEAFDEAGAPAA
ncbi:hypothetical protein OGATHE_002569 [Ogataea polymorpha]|uniref:Uncharacterized protein n=1 Tax=Ogataea polymorpha TaxID=460523 RepID=A0A9P8PDB2_9ASCO|nr:hypothetical protein OGATHE_002569 [Ogataea polymorpha]